MLRLTLQLAFQVCNRGITAFYHKIRLTSITAWLEQSLKRHYIFIPTLLPTHAQEGEWKQGFYKHNFSISNCKVKVKFSANSLPVQTYCSAFLLLLITEHNWRPVCKIGRLWMETNFKMSSLTLFVWTSVLNSCCLISSRQAL